MTFHELHLYTVLIIVFPVLALYYVPYWVIRYSRTHTEKAYCALVAEGIVWYYILLIAYESEFQLLLPFLIIGLGEIFIFGFWLLLVNWRILSRVRKGFFIACYSFFLFPGLFICSSYYLSATTVPVRSRLATATSGIRSIALALESYNTDHKCYPAAAITNRTVIPFTTEGNPVSAGFVSRMLTTPKAYLESIPFDPFHDRKTHVWARTYRYATDGKIAWILASRGPDRDFDLDLAAYITEASCDITRYLTQFGGTQVEYDPTNGLLSSGDVFRTGP